LLTFGENNHIGAAFDAERSLQRNGAHECRFEFAIEEPGQQSGAVAPIGATGGPQNRGSIEIRSSTVRRA
jgi:hypothetical protein